MRLHAFNAKKEYQKLMFKRNKAKYVKYGTIILSVCILIFAIMYFSFSKFSTAKKFNVINAKVGDFSSGDYTITAYIDGTKSSTIPLKTDGYGVEKIECSNDAVGSWDSDKWGIIITNATVSGTKCNVYFITVKSYDYTGSEQTFTASQSGYYVIEAWGASGGGTGGYGGYSKGTINLTSNQSLYIFVGGAGVAQDTTGVGGYNGGGSTQATNGKRGPSGGGATDIRLISGEWNNDEGLKSRIMVAAGGGVGASVNYGSGGGLKGTDGYSTSYQYYANIGKAGTQLNGGAKPTVVVDAVSNGTAGDFGIGGIGGASRSDVQTGGGSGGGSGYFGGSGASGLYNSSFPSGGGSSYISGYLGCVAITSSSSLTPRNDANGTQCTETSAASDITCSYHYSGKIFTNTQMIAGNATMPTHDGTSTMTGNSGNGYAKITFIGTSLN